MGKDFGVFYSGTTLDNSVTMYGKCLTLIVQLGPRVYSVSVEYSN